MAVPGAQLVLFVEPSDTLPTAPPVQPSLGAGDPSGFWQLTRIQGVADAAAGMTVAAPIISSVVSDRTPSVALIDRLARCSMRMVSPIVVGWSAGLKLCSALSIRGP